MNNTLSLRTYDLTLYEKGKSPVILDSLDTARDAILNAAAYLRLTRHGMDFDAAEKLLLTTGEISFTAGSRYKEETITIMEWTRQ